MRITYVVGLSAQLLVPAILARPLEGQTSGVPTISSRQFASGSAQVQVSGSVQIDQEVAINPQASFGDGQMTWLQFGVSGSDAPHALITYQPGEVGISVGRGKFVATAGVIVGEPRQCSGGTQVTGTSVTGHYKCAGITSYDAATRQMGEIDIEIRFTAES